ncbi:hypothetical protein QJS66_09910 [Kocuria rhizophila]|nr:hypothetical protein QJS66_09910 [Kocuria rhizophila]
MSRGQTRETSLRRTLAQGRPRHGAAHRPRTHPARTHRSPDRARILDRRRSPALRGFDIDTDFTPTKLRELAKMDGAIVRRQGRHPHPEGRRAAHAGRGHHHAGVRNPALLRRAHRQRPGAGHLR